MELPRHPENPNSTPLIPNLSQATADENEKSRRLLSPITSSASSPFSDYNSDRSGNFSSPDHTHRILVSCVSNDLGAGVVKPPVSLISSSDTQLQEYGVTAILSLSLCDENKGVIALVRALRSGTATAMENAACALLRLSQLEENKAAIGRAGAILPLVELLETGTSRGKKDAPNFIATMILYNLCLEILPHKIK